MSSEADWRTAGSVIELIPCPDGAILTVRADGDLWAWTCNRDEHGAHGTQQDVVKDADWHRDQHQEVRP